MEDETRRTPTPRARMAARTAPFARPAAFARSAVSAVAVALLLLGGAAGPWGGIARAQEAGGDGGAIERLRAEATVLRRAGLFARAPEAARTLEEALSEAARRRDEGAEAARVREALSRARGALRRIVEADVLAAARRDSAGAREADAHELTPHGWAEAGALLDRAEELLARSLSASLGGASEPVAADSGASALERARDEAGPTAEEAAGAYRAAWRLAFLADSIRDRPRALEEYVLGRDSAVARAAREAGVEPTPHDGSSDDLAAVRRELARRADTAASLRDRLAAERAARQEAAARADSLAAELDGVAGRLAEASSELERRRRREERIREVTALFSGQEASVLAAGDSLVLRLTGLTFPPGEAELPEGTHPLLVKLRSAIQAFPGAAIRVEGHTDARGDAERNRVLSQQRAIAVREHLLLNLPISADRVTAVGVGETEPVASNDSEDGRARNRRIDVVLTGLPE